MKDPTSISLPQGVRDILPEEAAKVSAVERAVIEVFERFDFQRVVTPLLEYLDVLKLGLGEEQRQRVFKFIDPTTGAVVAIRPDITPQIARMVATRMRDAALPLKLYYNENVLRSERGGGGKSREILQAGAEYLTESPSPEVDAEMIVMAMEALKAAGLERFKVDIGHVGFVKTVLNKLKVTTEQRNDITRAIGTKDAAGLETLLRGIAGAAGPDDRDLLVALTTFYGEEEVIEKARERVNDPEAAGCLDYIEKVVGIVDSRGFRDRVTIDLGEVRGFDYYTGIIFEGFSPGVGKAILGGGRYDTLVEKYGYRCSSTGFAFDLENIVTALERG